LKRWLTRCVLALVAWPLAAWTQGAPLFGYVDGAGVAHFADHAVDARYARILRERGDEDGRVPGKATARASLLTWLEFAPEVKAVQPLLRAAEHATGVDAELLKAIIAVESGYRSDLVSPRGAIGLMQITPQTGDRYATRAEARARPAEERLRDPAHNILAGARMLADLSRRYGGVDVALAAWNAGEGTVRRAGRRVPDIAETKAHVQLVLELYWALLQQRQHARVRDMSLTTGFD